MPNRGEDRAEYGDGLIKELSGNLTPFMIPEFIVKMPQIPAKSNGTEKIYLESSKDAKYLHEKIGFPDMQDYMKL